MITTCELLDMAKAKHGGLSDYALAKKLGITQSAISNYRGKRSFMDDVTADKVAKLLELDTAYVVAAVHRERAKRPEEQAVWQAILEKLGGAAAVVLLGIGGMLAPPPAYAFGLSSPVSFDSGANAHYSTRRKRKKKKNTPFSIAVELFKKTD